MTSVPQSVRRSARIKGENAPETPMPACRGTERKTARKASIMADLTNTIAATTTTTVDQPLDKPASVAVQTEAPTPAAEVEMKDDSTARQLVLDDIVVVTPTPSPSNEEIRVDWNLDELIGETAPETANRRVKFVYDSAGQFLHTAAAQPIPTPGDKCGDDAFQAESEVADDDEEEVIIPEPERMEMPAATPAPASVTGFLPKGSLSTAVASKRIEDTVPTVKLTAEAAAVFPTLAGARDAKTSDDFDMHDMCNMFKDGTAPALPNKLPLASTAKASGRDGFLPTGFISGQVQSRKL